MRMLSHPCRVYLHKYCYGYAAHSARRSTNFPCLRDGDVPGATAMFYQTRMCVKYIISDASAPLAWRLLFLLAP
jgi:hypothetical protein